MILAFVYTYAPIDSNLFDSWLRAWLLAIMVARNHGYAQSWSRATALRSRTMHPEASPEAFLSTCDKNVRC